MSPSIPPRRPPPCTSARRGVWFEPLPPWGVEPLQMDSYRWLDPEERLLDPVHQPVQDLIPLERKRVVLTEHGL